MFIGALVGRRLTAASLIGLALVGAAFGPRIDAAGPAKSRKKRVLVELYTSQG